MYAGNAVIANILMRWPVLIPGAVIAGGVALAEPETPPPPPPPVVVQPPAPIPAPVFELKATPEIKPVPVKPLPKKKKING